MSSIGMVLAWCPGQTPPAQCDPCKPQPPPPGTGGWPDPYAPNLKTAYFRYPGLFLWNSTDYVTMVQALASDAGGYTQTAHSASGVIATRTAKFTYTIVSAPNDPNTQWFLVVTYSFSPDPTPKFPAGTTFSVVGSYKWIGYQYANAGYLATTYTDTL